MRTSRPRTEKMPEIGFSSFLPRESSSLRVEVRHPSTKRDRTACASSSTSAPRHQVHSALYALARLGPENQSSLPHYARNPFVLCPKTLRFHPLSASRGCQRLKLLPNHPVDTGPTYHLWLGVCQITHSTWFKPRPGLSGGYAL